MGWNAGSNVPNPRVQWVNSRKMVACSHSKVGLFRTSLPVNTLSRMEYAKTRNGGLSSMMIYGNIIYAWCIQSFRKHSSLASHDDIMKNLEVRCNPVLNGRTEKSHPNLLLKQVFWGVFCSLGEEMPEATKIVQTTGRSQPLHHRKRQQK